MIETMEKELESQFTDLLSIVSDGGPGEDLDAVNSQLNAEIDEKLKSIELAKEELDEELRKRDSLIEFEKLDKNGFFSESDALIDRLNFFDKPSDSVFQKNSCETIEEKDENLTEDDPIEAGIANLDKLTDLSDPKELSDFFNLSRTNLNSVLEEDENEDSSQNDDLIGLNDIENDLNEELSRLESAAQRLDSGHPSNGRLEKELNNNSLESGNYRSDAFSPAADNKRNSCFSSNRDSIINDSSFSTTRNSTSSLNFSHNTSFNTTTNSIDNSHHDSTYNSMTNTLTINSSTLNSNTTTTTTNSNSTSVLSSIPCSLTRNESVINLESLNTETNVLVNNIFKKGVLSVWQASKLPSKGLTSSASTNSLKSNAKRIFFSIGTNKLKSWKARYFMLTENYLLCFKKGSKSDFLSKMGKYQFKLNLLDDVRSVELKETSTHGKSRCIDLNDGAMFLYEKDFALLKEWYDAIVKTRQRCEMMRQEQEIKFRKAKQGIQIQEILSDRIERRKLVPAGGVADGAKKRENLLDKFSEKYLVDKSLNSSSGKLCDPKKSEDDCAFEYLNNLRQRLSGATSVNELNRSVSNLAQIQKTNTPIISNRKRMSLQRKSLLSQFSDSFLGSPLSRSSSKQQISQQSNLDNIANLANLANLTAASAGDPNWSASQNGKQLIECTESPTMLPRIAPQCQGNQPTNGQLSKQNKLLTNSCSVFHFATNSSVHSPFTLNNSPALTQRSLYAERILSNSSLTLSNLSKFPNRHSTLSTGTSFSNSLFKPFRESIHYATSLRKDNPEGKSHLKSATSEFSFIRLTNNHHNSSNTSTLTKTQTDDDTLKRNKNAFNQSNFNRTHSFANDCSDYLDSEQDPSNSISDYNSDTLRNELRNSKTITNLNSELSKRTHILNPNDIGLGHQRPENHCQRNLPLNGQQPIGGQMNNNHRNFHNNVHNYQKLNKLKKKINNSLDESDSTFSSSNSSSSNSSNNYSLLMNSRHDAQLNGQRRLAHPVEHLRRTQEIRSYSPKLSDSPTLNHSSGNHSPRPANSPNLLNYGGPIMANSPLLNQRKKNPSKSNPNDKEHTYQKVNSKRTTSTKQSANGKSSSSSKSNSSSVNRNASSANKLTNGNKPAKKKANTSLIPVSDHPYSRPNEPIYQSTTSTEKRKPRMNRILENQSKIYVTMGDLK